MERKELNITDEMVLSTPDSSEIADFSLLYHRILLQRLDIGEKMGREELIYIPEKHKGVSILCKVVKTGPGWPHDTCPSCEGRVYAPVLVRPGDVVLISQHSGYGLRYKNTDCLIVSEEEILAIVEAQEESDRAQTTRKVAKIIH